MYFIPPVTPQENLFFTPVLFENYWLQEFLSLENFLVNFDTAVNIFILVLLVFSALSNYFFLIHLKNSDLCLAICLLLIFQ